MRDTLVDTFRQPEYTGENRCTPCTVLNLAIAGVISAAVARRSRPAGVVTLGASVAAISLRGYLVPGTPELTKRYLPAPVLELFGKESDPEIRGGLGAIDDLCLTDGFESAWNEEIDRIDADELDAADAARALGFDAEDHDFEIGSHGGDARTLRRDRQLIGNWPSQAALVADVTAARVLESRDDDWAAYQPAAKGELLNSLRLFLETCPTGGGEVVMGEETVESCCRSHDVVAVTCAETGERLFEHPVSDLDVEE